MTLNILVAPNGFKECLDAPAAARAICRGVRRALPEAHVMAVPMVDGGEGFTDVLVEATGGVRQVCRVTDPLGREVTATIGLLGNTDERTAVIEIAAAAGLHLLRPDERDMLRASSLGVGQLIRTVLNIGVRHVIIGCGDSGVNDGGTGLARALGARFLDGEGRELGAGVQELLRLTHIDLARLDARLKETRIDVAVNWHNRLLGPCGVTRRYGPQKGVTRDQIRILETALETYARCLRDATGIDVAAQNGSGASGGIGATLAGICGATLHPRLDIVTRYLDFDAHLREADLVITAEGALDWQTPLGKIPAEIGRRARPLGIPVIVLAGTTPEGAETNHAHGITAFRSIVREPCTREASMASVEALLESAAEQTVRTFAAGLQVGRRRAVASHAPQVAARRLASLTPAA
jgi:glycerate kinase